MESSITVPFYFVWNANGNVPKHRHETIESAVAEAERLARNYPGQQFIVLASVCARSFDSMQRVDLRDRSDWLPF